MNVISFKIDLRPFAGVWTDIDYDLTIILHNLAVAGALAFSADCGRCHCGRFPPMHRAKRWNMPCCYQCIPQNEHDRQQETP